jgi:phospholipid/cholesterol/gamma-HCH transport system substrate-binding protein
MDRKGQDLLLGGVFFAALGTLLAATFYLSDVEALFVERPRLEVEFDEVGGLAAGNSVFVRGYRVGEVGGLDYRAESRRVRVSLVLQQPVLLFDGYEIVIEDGSVLGGKQIDIDPGRGELEVPTGSVLEGRYAGGLADAFGGLDGVGINEIIDNVRVFSRNLVNEESTIYRLFAEDGLYRQAQDLVASAQRVLTQVEEGPGAAHAVIYDEVTAANVTEAIEGFRRFGESINDPEAGVIGALASNRDLLDRLNRIVDQVLATADDLQSNEGLIGRLLRDEKLADDLQTAIAEFRELGEKLTDPEAGTAGALIADAEWRARVDGILTDVESLTQSLVNGDGLLGRLINDPAIGEQFDRILNQVSRAIEDAREAAPVATFFSVITGAF